MRILDRVLHILRSASQTDTPPRKSGQDASQPDALTRRSGQDASPYLTQKVVFGMRFAGDDSSVCFVDEARGIRRLLVDPVGNIRHFPGIVREDFWTKIVSPNALRPQVHFRTSFEERDQGWIMFWQIQPDGRYWADEDGFGMEDDEEVTLYTYVDRDGRFTGPFRIYRVGYHVYSLDRFEHQRTRKYLEALQKLEEGNTETPYVQKPEELLFPRLQDPEFYNAWHHTYALWDRDEALAYWRHPLLSRDLLAATEILLRMEKPILELGGHQSKNHIHASMTLFWLVTEDPRFRAVLDKYYEGNLNRRTADRLG